MINYLHTKRICLFAGYNPTKNIPDYVIDYLRELSNFADIYYLADGYLEDGELERLSEICVAAWVCNHEKYDFGSYSELAKTYIGWEKIREYDELIFANDSCFCLQSLEPVFLKMEYEPCDVWGLLVTDENNLESLYPLEEYVSMPLKKNMERFCLGSYFVVFRKRIIEDKNFEIFINSVKKEETRLDVCIHYEMGLTRFFQKNKYTLSAYIKIVYKGVAIYDEQAFRLLKKGFPLIKIRIFKDNPLSIESLSTWIPIIIKYTNNPHILYYLEEIGYHNNDLNTPFTKKMRNYLVPPIFRKGLKTAFAEILPPVITTFFSEIGFIFIQKKNRFCLKPDRQNLPIHAKKDKKKIILFFNVAKDIIMGGMLSINRFVHYSQMLEDTFDFSVLVSGLPFYKNPVHYSLFKAVSPMVHFSDIVTDLHPDSLLIHIPECYVRSFIDGLIPSYISWLKNIPELQINILDQNHELFPDRYYIERCRELTDDVTITTAHTRYTTQELASQYRCPVSLLTPFLPNFIQIPFKNKEKIIALSNDKLIWDAFSKKKIIDKLKDEMPDYQIIIINNLSLERYKDLISRSRFVITFGEGYDGYYIEPFLSGTISFAVYNATFFPEEFKNAPTVYPTWDDLYSNICVFMRNLENHPEQYYHSINHTKTIIEKYTSNQISMRNLQSFYERDYTYLPKIYSNDYLFEKGSNKIDAYKEISSHVSDIT